MTVLIILAMRLLFWAITVHSSWPSAIYAVFTTQLPLSGTKAAPHKKEEELAKRETKESILERNTTRFIPN